MRFICHRPFPAAVMPLIGILLILWFTVTVPVADPTAVPVPGQPVTFAPLVQERHSPRWALPLSSAANILQPFVSPEHRYAAGHRGIDFAVHEGTAVSAPTAGRVHFVGLVAGRPLISIRVDAHTIYTLEPVESGLHVGDDVMAGQLLGVTSSGGHCEAHCLHLGVRVHDDYVNPLRFLANKPTLLPVGSSQ